MRSSTNRASVERCVVAERDRLRIEDEVGVLARLDEAPRAAESGNDLDGRLGSGREGLVGHGGDGIDREPAQPGEVEPDVVLGEIELLQIRAHGPCREALVAKLGDRGVPVPLRELLAVRAEHEPVMDDLRQLAAERARDALLDLHVRAVVVPADDVRDPELEIVDDGGELIRRAPVGANERRAGAREPHGAVVVALGAAGLERARGGRGVRLTTLALSHRPFVELDLEPGEIAEDRLLAARDGARRIRVIDPQQQRAAVRVCEPAVGDGRERIAEMQRAGRARSEANADGHGLRVDRNVPRLAGDPLDPRADLRVRLELEPALVRDVRVRVERDVRDRVPVADEELAPGEVPFHGVESGVTALHPLGQAIA